MPSLVGSEMCIRDSLDVRPVPEQHEILLQEGIAISAGDPQFHTHRTLFDPLQGSVPEPADFIAERKDTMCPCIAAGFVNDHRDRTLPRKYVNLVLLVLQLHDVPGFTIDFKAYPIVFQNGSLCCQWFSGIRALAFLVLEDPINPIT